MVECCIARSTVITSVNSSAFSLIKDRGETYEISTEGTHSAIATIESMPDKKGDEDNGPSVGVIVGVAVAVVVVVLLLSMATCGKSTLISSLKSNPPKKPPLYRPLVGPIDGCYSQIGVTPMLSMRVPTQGQMDRRHTNNTSYSCRGQTPLLSMRMPIQVRGEDGR